MLKNDFQVILCLDFFYYLFLIKFDLLSVIIYYGLRLKKCGIKIVLKYVEEEYDISYYGYGVVFVMFVI